MCKRKKTKEMIIFIKAAVPGLLLAQSRVHARDYIVNNAVKCDVPAAMIFLWVMITPFGGPVVPEVYMIHAKSSGLGGFGS